MKNARELAVCVLCLGLAGLWPPGDGSWWWRRSRWWRRLASLGQPITVDEPPLNTGGSPLGWPVDTLGSPICSSECPFDSTLDSTKPARCLTSHNAT